MTKLRALRAHKILTSVSLTSLLLLGMAGAAGTVAFPNAFGASPPLASSHAVNVSNGGPVAESPAFNQPSLPLAPAISSPSATNFSQSSALQNPAAPPATLPPSGNSPFQSQGIVPFGNPTPSNAANPALSQ